MMSIKKIKRPDAQTVKKYSTSAVVSIFRYLFLILVGYVVLYPLIYMISNSVKSQADFLNVSRIWLPKYWNFDKYKEVWEICNMKTAFTKTVTIQIVSAFIEVATCSLAGYGLARYNFRLKKLESVLLILLLLVPVQMYSLAMAVTYRDLGIFDTPFVYYLPSIFGVGVRGGMIIFIYRQFFEGLPKELEEAAFVDGAGPVRTFLRIAIPSSSVVILTTSVLSFVWHWNDNYIADLCFMSDNRPLASVMANLQAIIRMLGTFPEKPEYPAYVSAACIIYIAVPLVLYMIVQRWFVRSIDRVGITG
ncbi:MAG: carbohydrate ABC transporter permease [Clostridia bacterium]|nr:carbohydrate ABC transporter permease [Clostridia bacterium]